MDKVDEVYHKLLHDIVVNGDIKNDRTGTGTISVFGRQIRFNMDDGFPMLTTKKMFVKGIITELLWFLNGETNIKPLVEQGNMIWVGDAYKKYTHYHNNHPTIHSNRFDILSKSDFIEKIKIDNSFANEWGELGPIYGKQWVDWNGTEDEKGINQIQNVIDTLKNSPTSRRIMVNAWNPSDLSEMTLPPCHYGFEFNTSELSLFERKEICLKTKGIELDNGVASDEHSHNNFDKLGIPKYKLSLMWHQRSVDTFLGLPFNITSYAFLLHMVAQQVNMVPNELIGSLGDTHIYTNHVTQVNQILKREPMELPILELNKSKSIFDYTYDDFKIVGYESHPPIKAPLSN